MKNLFNKLFGVVVITDKFYPKSHRTEKQLSYDSVLKIQDELVKHKVIKIEHLEDGQIKVTLRCLK